MPLRQYSSIPHEAHFLSRDASTLFAYDSQRKLLGVVKQPAHRKRQNQANQGTKCTLVDQSTLARLPSYKLIEQYATTNWGGDWDRMSTNLPQYPDTPASVCVDGDPPSLSLTGVPQCTTAASSSPGTVAQTTGNLDLMYQRGTSTQMQMQVTDASLFPFLNGPVLAQVNMPTLSPNLEAFPTDVTIMNQNTATANVEKNSFRNTTVTTPASAGQTCGLSLTTTTCTGSGTGRIRIAASGWVWLNYPSPRDGHYFWAVSIENTITNIEDRSSYIEFSASAKSTGITQTAPSCAFVNAPAENNSGVQTGRTVSPVLVALPVVLGCIAVVLAVVAFIVWRRRRRERMQTPSPAGRHARMPSANTSAAVSMVQSQHPGVTPVFFPPTASSVPPSHSRSNPSIDTSSGPLTSQTGHPFSYATRGQEKARIAQHYAAGDSAPAGAMPPAYSETPSSSSRGADGPLSSSGPASNGSYQRS